MKGVVVTGTGALCGAGRSPAAIADALLEGRSALAVHRGEMPINANLVERDVDCNLNFVTGSPRRQRVRVAMSNSFGFGGSNSCVVVRRPEDVDGIGASR